MTIQPFECILNPVSSLLSKGTLLPLARRFCKPPNVPLGVRDVLLWNYSADKGGGSWKLLVNPVNVQSPQSLRQVQPICEFTVHDSRDNMTMAVFYNGLPCRADMEDVLHRRAALLHVKVGA